MCLEIPGVGFGCILHMIQSVVVGCKGQVYDGVVVVRGGHLSFGHGHQVDQKVFRPYLH